MRKSYFIFLIFLFSWSFILIEFLLFKEMNLYKYLCDVVLLVLFYESYDSNPIHIEKSESFLIFLAGAGFEPRELEVMGLAR